MTKFDKVKQFVNSHETFTRQEYLRAINDTYIIGGRYYTDDHYLNLLQRAGYVRRLRPAEYVVDYVIPEQLTSTELRKYSQS